MRIPEDYKEQIAAYFLWKKGINNIEHCNFCFYVNEQEGYYLIFDIEESIPDSSEFKTIDHGEIKIFRNHGQPFLLYLESQCGFGHTQFFHF